MKLRQIANAFGALASTAVAVTWIIDAIKAIGRGAPAPDVIVPMAFALPSALLTAACIVALRRRQWVDPKLILLVLVLLMVIYVGSNHLVMH